MFPKDLCRQAYAAREKGVTPARLNQWIKAGDLKVYDQYGIPMVSLSEVMNHKPRRPGRPWPAKKKKAKV